MPLCEYFIFVKPALLNTAGIYKTQSHEKNQSSFRTNYNDRGHCNF